jgi:NAD(P)-dependent dehydrogenase (short-subunit alcohol dehydrogenase family)
MTDVTSRTAFITGSANGIGLGIARAFAGAGAKLALVDIDAAALAQAKAELSKITEVETYLLDVSDRGAFGRVAADIEAKLGPVSLVVNNAGVAGVGRPAHKMSYELWDWGLGINLLGVINGVQTFLPALVERGQGGHIINTASGAGLVAGGISALYDTTKFAVVGLTESLRVELAPRGIGTTVVCPGPVATNIIEHTWRHRPQTGAPPSPEEEEALKARLRVSTEFLAKGAHPDEVGKMVLKGVQENRLYVHTDRIMFDAIQARTRELLAAMPA